MATRFSIEAVFKAVDRMSAPISKMQNRIQKFTRGMTRSLRRVNKQIGRMVSGLRRGASRIARFGGVILAAMGAATVIAIKRVADAADALAKEARRLQFPVEALQEWRFVAEQSGVTNELLTNSLGAFNKRLGEARGGTGPLVSGLKALNPQLLKQLVATDNVEEAFALYIDAIRDAPLAMEKAALANAAFSRSGLPLANIADNSAKAIKNLRSEVRAGVITKEMTKNAEDFNDASNSLKTTLGSFLKQAILPLLPAMTKYIKKFRLFLEEHREDILKKITAFLIALRTHFFALVDAVTTFSAKYDFAEKLNAGIGAMVTFAKFLGKNGGLILKLIVGLVALGAAFKVLSIIMLAISLIAAAPLVALGVAIAAVAAGIFLAWEPIKSFFLGLWEDIVNAGPVKVLLEIMKFLSNPLGGISRGIGKLLGFGGGDEEEDSEGQQGGSEEQGSPAPASAASKSQLITPGESAARSIEERQTTTLAEVTIRDETGRAEVTGGQLGAGLTLQKSGAF